MFYFSVRFDGRSRAMGSQALTLCLEMAGVDGDAAEKPGSLPEGTTVAQFNGFVDQAIDNRIERLQPILSETQLGSYRERVNGFRTMIKALISGGTGNK